MGSLGERWWKTRRPTVSWQSSLEQSISDVSPRWMLEKRCSSSSRRILSTRHCRLRLRKLLSSLAMLPAYVFRARSPVVMANCLLDRRYNNPPSSRLSFQPISPTCCTTLVCFPRLRPAPISLLSAPTSCSSMPSCCSATRGFGGSPANTLPQKEVKRASRGSRRYCQAST